MDRAAARRRSTRRRPTRRRSPTAEKAAQRAAAGRDARRPRATRDDGRGALRCCSALVAVGSALLVAVSSNLVHCALWLVVTLGALAGCYLLLAAEFVAWVQVLIYMGAVVVLLLFALMLTRAPTGVVPDLDQHQPVRRGAGRRSATCGSARSLTSRPASATPGSTYSDERHRRAPASVGSTMFGSWVLAFEIAQRAPARRAGRGDRAVPGDSESADGLMPLLFPLVLSSAAVRHRGVRRHGAPARGARPDGRRADAQRGQPQPGRVRRLVARRARLRSGAGPVRDRDRGGRDRPRSGDRAAGVPHASHINVDELRELADRDPVEVSTSISGPGSISERDS